MRTAEAVGMEMLFEPGHTGVGIKQSQNWKIHVHQYTKFALLVLLSLLFCLRQHGGVWGGFAVPRFLFTGSLWRLCRHSEPEIKYFGGLAALAQMSITHGSS